MQDWYLDHAGDGQAAKTYFNSPGRNVLFVWTMLFVAMYALFVSVIVSRSEAFATTQILTRTTGGNAMLPPRRLHLLRSSSVMFRPATFRRRGGLLNSFNLVGTPCL